MPSGEQAPVTSEPGAAPGGSRTGGNKRLVLAAMIFAVSMTFIDMTIVSIAIPEIQKELSLSSTGVQWVINAYLLALAAMFAFGGRLCDVVGHRKMVLLGVVVFVVASALNGLTPASDIAEAWLITFRVLQGVGAAIMYPAALAIVVAAFPLRERGRALAIFFAVAGGLTALGPLLGGFLTEWTWRAIFWVNIPVAIIAIVLTLVARPTDHWERAPIDYRGAVLIAAGMSLSVLGLQQSTAWGWGDWKTWGSIAAGLVLLVVFVLVELRTETPLIRVRIFRDRAFTVENLVLFTSMIVFVPVFFFASMYSQVALGWSASNAGTYLLIFFAGFAPAAQVGGRILDKVGAKPAVVIGCLVAAAGFALWAWKITDLSASAQWPYIVVAGFGVGLMLGPANTDAINRAPNTSYGEATGITQTVRNYGSSLGMALLGTLLITRFHSLVEATLVGAGLSQSQAEEIANSAMGSGGGDSSAFTSQAGPQYEKVFEAIQSDFASACQPVFYAMAGVMAIAFLLALLLPKGQPP